jgi:pimeloyl-ACP methyl ester carboxylesterase
MIDAPIQAMTLADGRCLTWQEFGLPEGKPALYFHGGGSIGLEAGIFHREAQHRAIRLIATNRPGVCGSSLCAGRPVAAYSDDLTELLNHLQIEKFTCLGESNGGLVTMAVAATLPERVLGAIPINPTVPWFDSIARSVTNCAAGIAYRLMKHAPGLLTALAVNSGERNRKSKSDLIGPPPGTEPDVAELHWHLMGCTSKPGLLAELKWASAGWGFDYYTIPVPLDFFCGVQDAQAPFALVLADRNPNARFHYFSFGHHGYSHPDARRRIFDMIDGYFA